MKTFNKMITSAVAGLLLGCAVVASGIAHAGTPSAVANATGTTVYGTEPVLSIEKDTGAGTNRVAAKYPSGVQYIADDASWTRYALLLAGLVKPVAVPTSTTGRVYDVSKSIIGCWGGGTQTIISWTNVGTADYLNDNCAYLQTVKSAL